MTRENIIKFLKKTLEELNQKQGEHMKKRDYPYGYPYGVKIDKTDYAIISASQTINAILLLMEGNIDDSELTRIAKNWIIGNLEEMEGAEQND